MNPAEDSGPELAQKAVWVDLTLRNGRLYGSVVGTDLVVSASSMSTLRLRLIDVLSQREPLAEPPRLYWRLDEQEIPYREGAAQWQVYRQSETDRLIQTLRPPAGEPTD